jgi:hypothetical protein
VTYDADNAANASKAYGVTTTTVKKGDDVIYFKTAAGVQYLIDVTQSVYGKDDTKIAAVQALYELIDNDVVAGTYTGTLKVVDGDGKDVSATFTVDGEDATNISTNNSTVKLVVTLPTGYELSGDPEFEVADTDTEPGIAQYTTQDGTLSYALTGIKNDFTLTFTVERSSYYVVKSGNTAGTSDYHDAESNVTVSGLTGKHALIKGADGNYYGLDGKSKGSTLDASCYVAITTGSVTITSMPTTDLTVTGGYYKVGSDKYYTEGQTVEQTGLTGSHAKAVNTDDTTKYVGFDVTEGNGSFTMPAYDVTITDQCYTITIDSTTTLYAVSGNVDLSNYVSGDYYTTDATDYEKFATKATELNVAADTTVTSDYALVAISGKTPVTQVTVTGGVKNGEYASYYVKNGSKLTLSPITGNPFTYAGTTYSSGDSLEVTVNGSGTVTLADPA